MPGPCMKAESKYDRRWALAYLVARDALRGIVNKPQRPAL